MKDLMSVKEFLERLYANLQQAHQRWCGKDVDDPEEMWTEYPEFIESTLQEVEELLEKPKPKQKDLVIMSALYGANGTFKDVRQIVANEVHDNRVSFLVTNFIFGGDPAPNVKKELRIEYCYSDKNPNVAGGMMSIENVHMKEIVVEEAQQLLIENK